MFLRQGLLCTSDWLGIPYVDQVGLELRALPASASLVRIKAAAPPHTSLLSILNLYVL